MDRMIDSWIDGIVAAIAGAWMTTLSFFARLEVKRIDGKADRSEVIAICERLEKNHDALVDRFDKNNESASLSRSKMHDKLDASIKAQSEFNLKVAQYMGRVNGRDE